MQFMMVTKMMVGFIDMKATEATDRRVGFEKRDYE